MSIESNKKQFKLVHVLRSKYNSMIKTPDRFKWIWKDDWTDIDYTTLKDNFLFSYNSTEEIKEFFLQPV